MELERALNSLRKMETAIATGVVSACRWITAAIDCVTLTVVLQQECFPVPMSQLPAIFWQHAISASVMEALGRQARSGAPANNSAVSSRRWRLRCTNKSYRNRASVR